MQHLGNGGQAVGGAAGVGNEGHVGGVGVLVHAHNKHGGVVLGGGGHDHVLGAGLDVALGLVLSQEQAGGLDDVLRADLLPGQVGGVALGEHGDGTAIHNDGVLAGGHLGVDLTVHGVILQHIGKVISGTQVVDAHDLDLGVVQAAPQDHAANTTKTIDTDFDAHKYSFLSVMEYIKHMVRLVLYARILENAIPACKFFYLLAGCDKYLVFFLCV